MNTTFSINQKELLDILTSMQPICNRRTTLDVTETIFFHITPRELTLKATDLEISLQSTADIESSAVENAGFLVSGKRIFELIKEMDGTISCVLDDAQLHLKANSVDVSLNIKDPQDFPQFPERIENLIQMDAEFLLMLLNKVAFLIPQNNANRALNGMLFEFTDGKLNMVATDGHCLAKISTKKYSLDEDKKWLLPKRAVIELKKILEVSNDKEVFLGICGNQLVFSGTHFNFFTKLIADPFPHYEPVLDKQGFLPARIAKNTFTKSLKRTGCFLAGQFLSTNFTFKKGILDVELQNKDVGKIEESLDLEGFQGDNVKSRFYSPYLLSGLQAFSDTAVDLHIKNDSKPIIFESNQENYSFSYVVMPVSAKQQQG